jgi:hypothetical protein
VGFFGQMVAWAIVAAASLAGVSLDLPATLTALYRFTDSVRVTLSHVVTEGLGPVVFQLENGLAATFEMGRALRDAINRTSGWIWSHQILPVWHGLDIKINTLNAQTAQKIADTRQFAYTLYLDAVRVATTLNIAERNARIADVNLARAQAQALTKALHQAIENEAAAGYRSGRGDRSSPLKALANDLHVRGLIDAVVTKLLIEAADVLVNTADPALAAVVDRVIGEVIKKSGIGKDLGDYLYGLIVPGSGGPDPKDLPGVMADVSHRLSAAEDWISSFMLAGGPEVEDAGRQWKTASSIAVDVALVAFVVQAVTAPEAWAREVADTVGVVGNDALIGIVNLIEHV